MMRILSTFFAALLFMTGPSTAQEPRDWIRHNPNLTSFVTLTGMAVTQHVTDPGRYSQGAAILTLPDVDVGTLGGGVLLGRIENRHLSWLPPEEYALGFISIGTSAIAVLPLKGWERGADYAVRVLETVRNREGEPLARKNATWLISTPGRRSTPRSTRVTNQGAAPSALPTGGRFPGGQNILFQGAWTDPTTGLAYHRGRWNDPRNGGFLTEDPKEAIDSENLYAFARWAPHGHTDPLGQSSRTDIKNDDLYYTWNFGWVDTTHAVNYYPSLGLAWEQLKKAEPGQLVSFTLVMNQGDPSNLVRKAVTFKETRLTGSIAAAATLQQRKQQLLFAWQTLSEDFESYQGEGIQGIQAFTSIYGLLNGEEEKIASSFSTEDLFSDLLAFHATVEGVSVGDLVKQYGGSTADVEERKEFSLLVWDYLLTPRQGGQTAWAPVFLDPHDLPSAEEVVNEVLRFQPATSPADALVRRQLRTSVQSDLDRLKELLLQYRRTYGEPGVPQALGLQPTAEGVTINALERR